MSWSPLPDSYGILTVGHGTCGHNRPATDPNDDTASAVARSDYTAARQAIIPARHRVGSELRYSSDGSLGARPPQTRTYPGT
ncbi:Uncharacterised protein [Mycobacteroides abscessus subsp. abscessus]|nr:Uncharacterised protein [Mycobacteroides abscessus subsp. abscessus]